MRFQSNYWDAISKWKFTSKLKYIINYFMVLILQDDRDITIYKNLNKIDVYIKRGTNVYN